MHHRPLLYGLFILCLALTLSCHSANSQTKIQGSVVDKELKPVVNANVLLLNVLDSSLVKGMITAGDGSFRFENIAKGKYFISSTFSGFEQVFSSPFAISDKALSINVDPLTLTQTTSELGTVTVTGRKPLYQQLIDRTVINVENSITSSGSTALEVLIRSPGIMVDHYNNTISMNGKNGVVLLINGKPNYMPVSAIVQMLSSMPSSNIEKIELITTPPSNLDAEGNAGFINIVLKTNNNVGTNGSFTVSGGYGKGILASPSFNFNHRKGNINIYGDASFDFERVAPAYITLYRKATNNGRLIETFSDTDRDVKEGNTNARLGLDWQASKRTIFGVLFTTFERLYKMHAWNLNTVTTEKVLDSSMRIFNTETNRWFSYSANINMQHNFRDNSSLTINADYIRYKNNQPVDYDNLRYDARGNFTYADRTLTDKTTPIHILVGAIDFSRKINSRVNVDAGVKYTASNFTNDIYYATVSNGTTVKNDSLSALYELKENYAAAYTTFSISVNKKTDVKIGGRYERTNSNLGSQTQKNIVNRQYGNFFPAIFFTHRINDDNSINVSYSKRITRPTFNDLAPFTYYVDPNTILTGNPALQPAYSHVVKTDYTFHNYFLSLSYTKEIASIQGFQPRTDSVQNKQILSSENIVNIKTFNASVTVPITITSWWSAQLNLMSTWSQANAVIDEEPVRVKNIGFGFNGSQRFTISPTWTAELSGFYQSASVFGIFVRRPVGSLDIGLKKKLTAKSSLQFAVTNTLNSIDFHVRADVPDHNIYNNLELRTFYRGFRLTYTQSFGKEKLKDKRNRTTGSEDEKGRVR